MATSIHQTGISTELTSSILDDMARKVLLKTFSTISIGRLVVEENGEVWHFGQAADETDLIAHIQIVHPSVYRDVLFNGTVGSGEAYMRGSWRSPDLVKVIRVMVLNMEMLNSMDDRNQLGRLALKIAYRLNPNSLRGSRRNISAHYDLGNDFFRLFLDPTMMYSSAVFPSAGASLEQASLYKLDRICKHLHLTADDHLLEIGTGWGGMAVYAAKQYGCRVTTTTISQRQYEFTCERVAREGLQDRITVLMQDYRQLEGRYDKLVSIEMIEAVGHQYYKTYFRKCAELLKPDGLMLIQAITIADQRYHDAKVTVDFIKRYIFPGGCLPSNEIIAQNVARHTDMQIVGLDDITQHYAQTLAHWRQRFHDQIGDVYQQGFDDIFARMWDFYLAYCEGGFAERVISTSQILLAKPRCRQLPSLSA